MRRLIVSTLLSLFLISGTGLAFADHHRGGDHEKGRKEQRYHKKRHDHKHGKEVHNRHRPQLPPSLPAYRPKHHNHAYHYQHYSIHDNLAYMVSRITRGGRDVNVWQVNPNTYVVRFRKGNHLYAQYLYPYEGRYGKRNTISVNWVPQSPWALIPSIHLNIDL